MTNVAAILLAAGKSRRMGAFKPLLPFGDKTVIESCVDYLRAGGASPIVVVTGHRQDEIRAHLKTTGVLFAVNPDPNSEMGASISCGVRQLPPEVKAMLIALTDQPAIPPAVVARLIEAWQGGAKLAIPQYQGRGGHPVLVDCAFRGDLLNLDPQSGLKGLFAAHRADVARPVVDTPYIARDLDTWDDYRALHREVFDVEPPAEARSQQER